MNKKFRKKTKKSNCQKNLNFLKYIHTLPRNRRNKLLLHNTTTNEIKSICELVFNFLYNNIKCNKKLVKSLKKYTSLFTKLTKKSIPIKIKRKVLVSKTGGFILTTLLNIGIPLISKLFSP